MKITDFCLIFIAITLPIIIVVYINVSFTIKAEEQEMYYQNLINAAIEDATSQMKQVENSDKNIDYGYSGESDKKVSVNAEIGKNAFFDSLYNNFGIKGNTAAEHYLQLFVPALMIIDYDGIYVSSIEEYKDKDGETVVQHTVKPKKKFTYTYYILDDDSIVSASSYDTNGNERKIISKHTVEFTMDDYITHRGIIGSAEIPKRSFYLADTHVGSLVDVGYATTMTVNNADLYRPLNSAESYDKIDNKDKEMIGKVVEHLRGVKNSLMIKTITDELAYSVNANNYFARNSGVVYNFSFPEIEQETLGEYINDIGILAFMQGLSVGNKYLDTRAYSVSRLELVNRYYLSIHSNNSKFDMNLYHMSQDCPEYKIFKNKFSDEVITPNYVLTKQQAASAVAKIGTKDNAGNINYNDDKKYVGFYPCPICNP